MRAVIVGGGVVGLFTAYYLSREGASVTIIDPNPGERSRAAAGILEFTRFKINRINVVGYPTSYLKMLARGNARIRRFDLKWLAAYIRVYAREAPKEVWESVKEMGRFSWAEYRRLAEEKNDFDYAEEPLYELVEDVEAEAEELRRDPLQPKFEIAEFAGRRAIAYLEAAKLSTDLATARLISEARAEVVKASAEAVGDGYAVVGGKRIEGDVVVVAAGVGAADLLGLPVAPFKGYGFRLRAKAPRGMFIDLADTGVAVVPLSQWVKATGRFDLDSSRDDSPAARVLAGAEKLLGSAEVIDLAVGYRPCTPDGLPIVEKAGERLVVATGACRLGWTFGPALGRYAADLALGKRGETPFKSSRFYVVL
jgi:D-proline dehydrogenase|nr:MAG: D-proline dehydrogenase [Thermoproteus sp. AZ2]